MREGQPAILRKRRAAFESREQALVERHAHDHRADPVRPTAMRILRLGTPSLRERETERPRTRLVFGPDSLRSRRRSRCSNARCTRCEDAMACARSPAAARARR